MPDKAPRTLDGIALLENLSPEAHEALARRCAWRRFSAHEQIIDRASDSHDVYFVIQGVVRVVNYSYGGREVSYDDIAAGGMFGEMAAIDGAPRSATVVALEDTVTAVLAPEIFMTLLREHDDLAVIIMKRLVQIIRGSTDRIMDLSTRGAPNRIHAEILRMARPSLKDDNSAMIENMPVHADIASRAGTTRETVARALSDLARRGVIRKDGHTIVIPDFERLEDLVEEG